tara:strand:- start:3821 stop:4696 length:876 start_codon:yes stop_codon:yes gene_type:complete
MKILDGKSLSNIIKEEIKKSVVARELNGLKKPHLAAVLIGNDGASLTYVESKIRSCKQVGILSSIVKLEQTISEEELLLEIRKLNDNYEIDGYIVQLPLPNHIDENLILKSIDPNKDVDGFHPSNFGLMALEIPKFIPATPNGIVEIIKRYKIPTSGKICLVIGRSNIVGRPISILMSQKKSYGNATVILAHSRTKNIKNLTLKSDIIISALGKPGFIKADMVKDNAVIIDVGITRVSDKNNPKGYIIKGDVDFENVSKKVSYITPVPGGVGPMTIAMLLKNTLLACQIKD